MQKELAPGFVSCVQRQTCGSVRQPYMTFLKEAWRGKSKRRLEMFCKEKQAELVASLNLCENEEGLCRLLSPWQSKIAAGKDAGLVQPVLGDECREQHIEVCFSAQQKGNFRNWTSEDAKSPISFPLSGCFAFSLFFLLVAIENSLFWPLTVHAMCWGRRG